MEIVILSSGRPFRQTTFNQLPKELQERTTILVPKKEAQAYAKFPTRTHDLNGVSPVRQFVIETTKDKKVLMLDDDLVFATRRKDDPTRFYNATESEVVGLFDEIEDSLREYAHVGVSGREGANYDTSRSRQATRMMRVLGYNVPVLRKLNIRFDRMQVMEDMDVTLSLLRAGYANLVLNHMVQNQNGSNAEGGCSQWRTPDIQKKAAYRLAELHPSFVKVVQKQTKTAWGGQMRTDVIVQWKKAFEYRE